MEIKYFNRELSWIEFNERILNQALNKNFPLLERLQFLSIVSSNFDEFFQVRVASVKRESFVNPDKSDISDLTPKLLLKSISMRTHQIVRQQQECLINEILPALTEKGIIYEKASDFTLHQKEYISNLFRSDIFPLLTPLRTDLESFPHIINLSNYVAFKLKPISGIKTISEDLKGTEENRIAIVQIPTSIPNVYWLPSIKKQKQFTLLEDIITQCGTQLFPGFEVQETLTFKVVRDADFTVDEESGTNFIHEMEKVLVQRKSSFPVQLICNSSSEEIKKFLMKNLELEEDDVYQVESFVNIPALMELRDTDDSEKMSFEDWEHFYPSDFPNDKPFWDVLKLHDKVLHVPYESYNPVIKFISDAADDPDVLAIKMVLYRTGRDSPIIAALERAAAQGKQVVVLVELKARFDEERNIAWASELENAGVTVVYGLVNLKVHAKILMVMRKEAGTVRRYVHLATGNYNPKTAKLYSDLSIFTANMEIANDATQFFNLVTGYSNLQKMNCLGMAPVTLKSKLLAMIQRETEKSSPENPGLIMAKMNSLTHSEIIEALYKASQAGVKVLLNVRGICMLVPGVKGMSENIHVISIVDRYLEHARVFYFQNAGIPELYCSSADWMSRNLDKRIELMFPILDKDVFTEIKSILDIYFSDNVSSFELQSSGEWTKVKGDKKDAKIRAQEVLYKKYKKRNEKVNKEPKVEFTVRRK